MPLKEFRMCLAPFQEYHSSGPFLEKKNDRMLIHLLKKGFSARTLTYARYLYSVNKGVEPSSDYEIDHIDGNRGNDSIANLQLLTVLENIKKSHKDPRNVSRRRILEMTCPSCGTVFQRARNKAHVGKKEGSRTYCSRKCSKERFQHPDTKQIWTEVVQAPIVYARYTEPWIKWSGKVVQEVQLSIKETSRDCPLCRRSFYPQYRSQRFCSNKCSVSSPDRNNAKISRNSAEPEILKIVKGESTWRTSSKLLGVSDKGLKKWAEKNGFLVTTRPYTKSAGYPIRICESRLVRELSHTD